METRIGKRTVTLDGGVYEDRTVVEMADNQFMELPKKTKADLMIEVDDKYVSPSYTRSYRLVAEKGEGMWITDPDGKKYLDFAAGIATCSTGHCHPKVVEAIRDQAGKLIHMSGTDFYYEKQSALAGRLCNLLPPQRQFKAYFGNSGAEAVESAFKLARWYTKRPVNIAFKGAFHGRTMGALSLTGSKSVQKENFYPLVPQVMHVPYANCRRCVYNKTYPSCNVFCLKFLDELFDTLVKPEQVAALFIEPIQGEGGYIVPPVEFIQKLYYKCKEHGILFIADEVQSGMGRTGKMFAMEHFGIVPDIICLAKGIASGMPLGAMLAPSHIMSWPPGAHASTFGGNPISCAAAMATIDLLEGGLIRNADEKGAILINALNELHNKYEWIDNVRGKGLMVAIDVIKNHNTREEWPKMRDDIINESFKKGLLLLGCGKSGIRFCPPLIVEENDIWHCMDILESILRKI